MQDSNEHVILFVCVENTFRSIMSEAIFNANAPRGWHAESAGVQPAEAVNPLAIELLREIGIAIGSKTPRPVSKELITRAWRVVTFGCVDRCPIGTKEKSEDWPFPGSTGKSMKELRELRKGLVTRILNLIREIEAQDG